MSPLLDPFAARAERLAQQLTLRRPAWGLHLAAALGAMAALRAQCGRTLRADEVHELLGPMDAGRVQQIRREIAALQFRNQGLRLLLDRCGPGAMVPLVERVRAEPLLRVREEQRPIVVAGWHQGPVRATSVALRALGVPALFAVARWNREPDSDHDVVRYARLQTSADEARFLKRAHRALADGRIVGVNLDVVRAGGEDGFFLGRRIRVGRGAAALARLTGARLVPVTRRFLGMSGRIEVTFHEPIADGDLDRASGMAFDGALLTRATAWFEAQARNHPGSLRRDRLESLLAAPPVDASDPDTASRAAQRRARLDEERHARHRAEWEAKWASSGFERPWLGRGISREIEEAVASGWFPPGARALDAGCGEGDVAAWLASRGYAAVGVDVAEAALERARNAHGERPPSLRFARVDLSRSVPEGGPFQVVVDRGCFHQIAEADRRAYAGHLASACAADARLLMFSRAFRDGVACGDPEEIRRKRAEVMEAFAPHFELQREAPTYLDRCHGARPDERLPGIVFWLRRRGSAEDS